MTLVASTSIAGSPEGTSAERPDARDLTRPPRLAVFRAPGFPTVDAPEIAEATLRDATAGIPAVVFESPEALAEGLKLGQADVLLLSYGSAFPLEAWPSIRRFVKSGGGLVVLGGAPFAQPVRRLAANSQGVRTYALGTRQPSFAHELLIGPAEPVEAGEIEGPARVVPAEGSD